MSVALVPSVIGGAAAAASSAAMVQNILAGIDPSAAGVDPTTIYAKDVGGFEFDYIGEERVEAGTEISEHYSEDNSFMQDHIAVKPSVIIMRGFVAEQAYNKTTIVPELLALATALTPVTPYIGKYSPGAAAAMGQAVTQTVSILQSLAQIQNLYGSVSKVLGGLAGTQVTKVRAAYNTLDALRISGAPFAVVTPWATFGDPGTSGDPNVQLPHGLMMIESMVLVAPEDTRGWADIVVRLKEIRVAPSLAVVKQDNARGSQAPTFNGTIGGDTILGFALSGTPGY